MTIYPVQITEPTIILQACVGPSLLKVHVRRIGETNGLTLCERTAVVTDYRGKLFLGKLCQGCHRAALALKKEREIYAEMIGVRELT